jgi:hypothetical protein
MKRSLLGLACAAMLAAACGGSSSGGIAGETPIPPQPSDAAGGGPSINITIAGAVTGSSTQLASDRANHCSSLHGAETISIYSMNLYPVINGTDYHLSVIVTQFHGPIMLNVASDNAGGNRITVLFSDAANNGSVWGVTASTTGTLGIDAKGAGHVDLKGLPALYGTSTLDISGSWTC